MRADGEMGWIVDSSPTGLTWHIRSSGVLAVVDRCM